MKKLKILNVVLHVELPEDLEEGTQVFLDEQFKIHRGDVVKTDEGTIGLVYKPFYDKNIDGQSINERYYYKEDDLKEETRETLKFEDLKSRKATISEEKQIYDYIYSKNNGNSFDDEEDEPIEPTIDLRIFDISSTNKLVYNLVCILNTFTNGEKEIFQTIEKYNIRHGLVYQINDEEDLLDYDEDISDITNILK
jgi:uncharacterized lipoprotein YehR (DUF1307 family)